MDNRWNRRAPVRINVVVHASGNGLISGRARDVSVGGMYVETAPHVYIGENSVVRVGFMVKNEMKIAHAYVTRCESGGFGFMFEETDPDMQRAVEKLIRSHAQMQQNASNPAPVN